MTDMDALACTEQNRVVLKGQLELTEQPKNKFKKRANGERTAGLENPAVLRGDRSDGSGMMN